MQKKKPITANAAFLAPDFEGPINHLAKLNTKFCGRRGRFGAITHCPDGVPVPDWGDGAT